MVTSAPRDEQKPSAKIHAWLHKLPLHQNHRYTNIPPTSLGQFLRVIWNAASQAIVLIFPEYNLTCNCRAVHFFFFKSALLIVVPFLPCAMVKGRAGFLPLELGAEDFLSGGCPWVCSHCVSAEVYTAEGHRLACVSTPERHGIRMEQMRYLRPLNVPEELMLLNR